MILAILRIYNLSFLLPIFEIPHYLSVPQALFKRQFLLKHLPHLGLHRRKHSSIPSNLLLNKQQNMIVVPETIWQIILTYLLWNQYFLSLLQIHDEKLFDEP